MCLSPRIPSPPPAPEIIPDTPPTVAKSTTSQMSPREAGTSDASGRNLNYASNVARKRLGRGSLRIPLASSGLSASGLNIPSA
jgi:hypothetical protein